MLTLMINYYKLNNDLHKLLRFQILIAHDQLSYTINNRKNGNLSNVHAYSPQVVGAKLPNGTALYFVSCDFKGDDPSRYTDNKFEAVKAYLDVLGVDYRIVVCNTLPRHNWKHTLRTKEVSLTRYDEIQIECKDNGKKAAEQFYQEAMLASPRVTLLSEQDLEKYVYTITFNANQHRVKQCQKIFGDEKVIVWSDYTHSMSNLIEDYQIALMGCHPAVLEGARKREGSLIDNIVYKQEELVVDLHIANSMIEQPVLGFYNSFTKYDDQTNHMKACREFGHFEVLDICHEDENQITQMLINAKMLVKPELKANNPEKQLAQFVREFPKLQPSLQREFVLELLEHAKMQVPAQFHFIDSCLKVYKTLPRPKQLTFIETLLDEPKKRVMAYKQLIQKYPLEPFIFDKGKFILCLYALTARHANIATEINNDANEAYCTFDPVKLFSAYESIKSLTKQYLEMNTVGLPPLMHQACIKSIYSQISLGCDSQTTSLLEIALDAGVDPNSRDHLGNTMLYSAMIHRNAQGVKSLIRSGAFIDESSESLYSNSSNLDSFKTHPEFSEIKEIVSAVGKALSKQKSKLN